MTTLPRTVIIRREQPADIPHIHAVNAAAFGSPAEADIVDAVRSSEPRHISLVAEEAGRLRGHIMFSPVRVEGAPGLEAFGLAPMAVAPDRQRAGIGTALVTAGLEACRQSGVEVVFVVGHPAYYPRFGFVPASTLGFSCEFEVADDAFMVAELVPGALSARRGTVYFHEAFKDA